MTYYNDKIIINTLIGIIIKNMNNKLILLAILTLSITITWSIIDTTCIPVLTNVLLLVLVDLMLN